MMKKSRSVGMELSFALYGAANRMARMHKPFLEPLGLTFPQYLVMLELLNGSPLSVGTLGASLDMDTGTITPLVKRLETAGFVTRTRDPNDERRVLVDLTPKAESIRDEIWSISQKIKSACKLDETGLIELRDTLQDLSRPRQE
ncbi:MarR family transcriptional regulator [Erwinia sp. MMLR14_017]|uniref:MarR family winged helix-turn-helix transcriptional regulator n=1 Tax=Erwinia sp. MMLR14_017 TaxID=3093842 RepID=UPI0029907F4D|nr:MarR family transcriptional regulator [Erwinia sp. MMLR14_017]MDW8846836.1 MarR family transcriptional regulator [Erwinia sp. MMLR14_017]